MAQSANEKQESITGIKPYWQNPAACAPAKWEEWLNDFFMICDLKEKCMTRTLLKDPEVIIPEPYPKLEAAPDNEDPTEKASRDHRNATAILRTDALNAEAKRKGPKIGHAAFFHEVDNSVRARLYLSIGAEAQRRLKLKHPKIEIATESVKTLVEKLDALFKLEKNITYERVLLFSRSQRNGESLELFHNALSELAKTCDLGTLEESLVKDLFVAKMSNKELQVKFCKDKTSPEDVLKEIILHERGTRVSNTFQSKSYQHSSHQDPKISYQIKEEPTFAIDRQFKGKNSGNRRDKDRTTRKGGAAKKNNQCRNCGGNWPHEPKDSCPAKGKECSLCKRSGHFASMCRNARPKVESIEQPEEQRADEATDQAGDQSQS